MSQKHFTFWTVGQILLDLPDVSQKWLSYNSVNWINPIGLSGMAEFGPLLYNYVIKTVNLLAARNNIKKLKFTYVGMSSG